eukprot:scaffold7214_cov105-Skeletonema_dohrnii-CCMP3373.AAC.1
MEDGGITHKKSEETDVSSVKAMHQAVQEDPNVTSPDRIINRVVTWWDYLGKVTPRPIVSYTSEILLSASKTTAFYSHSPT